MGINEEDFATLQDPEFHRFVSERMGFSQPKPPEGGFLNSARQTGGQVLKGFGQLGADYLPGVGQDNALKRYGQSVVDANPTQVHDFASFAESPWTGTKEAVGNAVAPMGLAAGAAGLGTAIGMIPHPVAQVVGRGLQFFGTGTGAAALYGAPSYSGIREQQMADNPSMQDSTGGKLAALAGAGTVGAIEQRFGPQQWAGQMMTKEGREAVAKYFAGKSLPGAIGKGVLKGGAVEGAEELAQNPVEQMAAFQNPLTRENLGETAFGGFMGAVGGGVLGGGFGGLSYRRPRGEKPPTPIEEAAPTDLLLPYRPDGGGAQGFLPGNLPDGGADLLGETDAVRQNEAMWREREAQAFWGGTPTGDSADFFNNQGWAPSQDGLMTPGYYDGSEQVADLYGDRSGTVDMFGAPVGPFQQTDTPYVPEGRTQLPGATGYMADMFGGDPRLPNVPREAAPTTGASSLLLPTGAMEDSPAMRMRDLFPPALAPTEDPLNAQITAARAADKAEAQQQAQATQAYQQKKQFYDALKTRKDNGQLLSGFELSILAQGEPAPPSFTPPKPASQVTLPGDAPTIEIPRTSSRSQRGPTKPVVPSSPTTTREAIFDARLANKITRDAAAELVSALDQNPKRWQQYANDLQALLVEHERLNAPREGFTPGENTQQIENEKADALGARLMDNAKRVAMSWGEILNSGVPLSRLNIGTLTHKAAKVNREKLSQDIQEGLQTRAKAYAKEHGITEEAALRILTTQAKLDRGQSLDSEEDIEYTAGGMSNEDDAGMFVVKGVRGSKKTYGARPNYKGLVTLLEQLRNANANPSIAKAAVMVLEGTPYTEVADAFGVSEGTITNWLRSVNLTQQQIVGFRQEATPDAWEGMSEADWVGEGFKVSDRPQGAVTGERTGAAESEIIDDVLSGLAEEAEKNNADLKNLGTRVRLAAKEVNAALKAVEDVSPKATDATIRKLMDKLESTRNRWEDTVSAYEAKLAEIQRAEQAKETQAKKEAARAAKAAETEKAIEGKRATLAATAAAAAQTVEENTALHALLKGAVGPISEEELESARDQWNDYVHQAQKDENRELPLFSATKRNPDELSTDQQAEVILAMRRLERDRAEIGRTFANSPDDWLRATKAAFARLNKTFEGIADELDGRSENGGDVAAETAGDFDQAVSEGGTWQEAAGDRADGRPDGQSDGTSGPDVLTSLGDLKRGLAEKEAADKAAADQAEAARAKRSDAAKRGAEARKERLVTEASEREAQQRADRKAAEEAAEHQEFQLKIGDAVVTASNSQHGKVMFVLPAKSGKGRIAVIKLNGVDEPIRVPEKAWNTNTLRKAENRNDGPVVRLAKDGNPVPENKQLSTEQLTQVVEEFFRGFGETPPVLVEASEAGVVPGGSPGGSAGAVYDGKVYLFRDGIGSVNDAIQTLWHEVFHFGLRRFMTESQYIAKMNQLADRDRGLAAYAAYWVGSAEGKALKAQGRSDAYVRARGVDEALAQISEQQKGKLGLTQKLILTLTRWMAGLARAFKLYKLAGTINNLNNAEAKLFVQKTLDMLRSGAAPAQEGSNFTADPAFSKADTANSWEMSYAQNVMETIKAKGKQLIMGGMFLNDLRGFAVAKVPAIGRYIDAVQQKLAERTKLELPLRAVEERFYNLSSDDQDTVNRFLEESTVSRLWAYQPKFLKKKVAIDPDMKREFDAIKKANPHMATVIEETFQLGYDQLKAREEALGHRTFGVLSNNLKSLKELEQQAILAKDDKARTEIRETRQKLQDSMKKMTGLRDAVLPMMETPYVPLSRKGDHVLTFTSPEYRAAEAKGKQSEIRKLKADRSHYQVYFEDGVFAANNRVTDVLRNNPQFRDVPRSAIMKPRKMPEFGEMPYDVFERLLKSTDQEDFSNLPPLQAAIAKHKVTTAISDMYLRYLDSEHVRKSELERIGVAGYDQDIMRGVIDKGKREATYTSALNTADDIMSALMEVQRAALDRTAGRYERAQIVNEVLRRYVNAMDYRETPWQDRFMRFNSVWMLLSNPAYYVQNSLQPWVVSMPVMAAHEGFGVKRTADELFRAYDEVRAVWQDARKSGSAFDMASIKDKGEREMLLGLLNKGHLDVTINAELGEAAKTAGQTKVGRLMFKMSHGMRMAAQHIEMANRIATALAAYRISIENGKSVEDAAAFADKMVVDTHGDYSGHNAPRWFMQGRSPIPVKAITQFKKFQLIQLSLLVRSFNTAFDGKDETEKALGRRILRNLIINHAAFAGALGAPIASTLAYALGALGGDDGEDKEEALRRMIGDKKLADLILHGVPGALGVNLTNKVGMGGSDILGVLNPLPFVNAGKTAKETGTNVMWGLAGPTGTQAQRALNAYDFMARGDYYKGLEQLLPALPRNAMAAYRQNTEGITNRRGDVVMSPDELSIVDGFLQAAGLPTMTVTERNRKAGVLFETDQKIQSRSSEIKHRYLQAAKAQDRAEMTGLRTEWLELQEDRKRLGYKTQPLSDLIKAPREQAKRERKVEGGLPYTDANRGFVQRLNSS